MSVDPSIRIGERAIGANTPTYIIAEIGVNHNGDAELAHKMIDKACEAGADAVKFQTYRTQDIVLDEAPRANYQADAIGDGSQRDMLSRLELPFETFASLQDHCKVLNVDFMSTAFDPVSLDFVASLSPACLKWPSGELTNLPLLRQAARTHLPIMLSTGMGSVSEIAAAMDVLGADAQVVILQCVSNYPARIEDQNLRVLPNLSSVFGCPVGLSDHTIGPFAAIAARALGMSVLEKHFTLDRNMEGPDHFASIEPDDFSDMVKVLRQIEIGLGDGVKRPLEVEQNVKQAARKSLVYREGLPKGHILTEDDFTAKRPGIGISPSQIDLYIGLRLTQIVQANTLVKISDVR
jgi:sialic acid synthase SpsE